MQTPTVVHAYERLSQVRGPTDAEPRPDLTDGQWSALFDLFSKQSGGSTPWTNIADAQALTETGFARRTGEGWSITPAGETALLAEARRRFAPKG